MFSLLQVSHQYSKSLPADEASAKREAPDGRDVVAARVPFQDFRGGTFEAGVSQPQLHPVSLHRRHAFLDLRRLPHFQILQTLLLQSEDSQA